MLHRKAFSTAIIASLPVILQMTFCAVVSFMPGSKGCEPGLWARLMWAIVDGSYPGVYLHDLNVDDHSDKGILSLDFYHTTLKGIHLEMFYYCSNRGYLQWLQVRLEIILMCLAH